MFAHLLTLLAAQAIPAASAADPLTLFRSVCLGDEVRLSAREFTDTSVRKIPYRARGALGFASLHNPSAWRPALPLKSSEVPNRILKKGRGDVLLILPAPGKKGAFAPACAVLWKGSDFARARGLLVSDFDLSAQSASLPGRTQFIQTSGRGASAAAAEWEGWTVLRVMPEAPTNVSADNK